MPSETLGYLAELVDRQERSLEREPGSGAPCASLRAHSRRVSKLLAERPIRARLSDEVDTPFAALTRSTHEQPGSLQYLEFGVDRACAGRVTERLRQILDADDSVAVGNGGPDLEAVLRASEQRARSVPEPRAVWLV